MIYLYFPFRSLQRFIEEELRPNLPEYIKQVEYPDFLEDDDFNDVDEGELCGPFLDADELFAIDLRKVSIFVSFIFALLIYPLFRPLPYASMVFLVFLKKKILKRMMTVQLLILMIMRVLIPSLMTKTLKVGLICFGVHLKLSMKISQSMM